MDDLISREEAIDTLNVGTELLRRVLDDADVVGAEREKYEWGLELIESYISDMKELPSAQPERLTDDDLISREGEERKPGELKTGGVVGEEKSTAVLITEPIEKMDIIHALERLDRALKQAIECGQDTATTVLNADKFQTTFGFYATAMWAMPEGEFFEWLNAEYKEEK